MCIRDSFEAEYGEVTNVLPIRRKEPVEKYMMLQKRFAHLFGKKGDPEIVARMQALADRNIARYGLMGEERSDDSPVPEQAEERHNVI